jgi:hypothetical protein
MPSSGRPARVCSHHLPARRDVTSRPRRDLRAVTFAVGMVDEKEKLVLVKGDAAWLPRTHCFHRLPIRALLRTEDLDSEPSVLADVSNQLRMPTEIGRAPVPKSNVIRHPRNEALDTACIH